MTADDAIHAPAFGEFYERNKLNYTYSFQFRLALNWKRNSRQMQKEKVDD